MEISNVFFERKAITSYRIYFSLRRSNIFMRNPFWSTWKYSSRLKGRF